MNNLESFTTEEKEDGRTKTTSVKLYKNGDDNYELFIKTKYTPESEYWPNWDSRSVVLSQENISKMMKLITDVVTRK